MMDLLKKTLYVSLGMISMTKDKIEVMGKKFSENAKMSETEGKQFIDELLKKSDEMKSSIENMITEKTEAALRTLHLPTRAELTALEERIKKIERKGEQGIL